MLKFTQGDDAVLSLKAELANSVPVDLTGAVFTTYFLGYQGQVLQYDNAQHTADPDQVTNRGDFTLTLSSSDTALVPAGQYKEVVTKIVLLAKTVYYHGENLLTVLPAKPVR